MCASRPCFASLANSDSAGQGVSIERDRFRRRQSRPRSSAGRSKSDEETLTGLFHPCSGAKKTETCTDSV